MEPPQTGKTHNFKGKAVDSGHTETSFPCPGERKAHSVKFLAKLCKQHDFSVVLCASRPQSRFFFDMVLFAELYNNSRASSAHQSFSIVFKIFCGPK